MTLVVDASLVVVALVDTGPVGTWAEDHLSTDTLAGPHLLPVETANILRRLELAERISPDVAAIAHDDLTHLGVDLFDYELLAPRCWQLRNNLTTYDACYVALAELLGAPLVTVDRSMAASTGPTCEFITPPEK